MAGKVDDEDDEVGLVQLVEDAVRKPIDIALSKTARRSYVSAALFVSAALALLVLAAASYTVFYLSYIPNRGFSVPVYLQFDATNNRHPFGTAHLNKELISAQPYDVHVLLDLPRTRSNQDAGNFMVDLRLLAPGPRAVGAAVVEAVTGEALPETLARARRPAILTYRSAIMRHAYNVMHFPWYLMGWRRESELLKIDIMEGVEFGRGWRNVPATARLELSSDTKLQVYHAQLVFTARFQGLRYLMYNHRVICFIVFTSVFWAVEVASAVVAWLLLSKFILAKPAPFPAKSEQPTDSEGVAIKAPPEDEEEDATDGLSDTSRTFPTFSRQPPLKYSSPKVKDESDVKPNLADIPHAGAEADDEDEDADLMLDEPAPIKGVHSDSGIGTSMESSAPGGRSVRRRKSGSPGLR